MTANSKLAAPLFLCSVFLLVLNDWYLKLNYPNWFTGKLSDFAGLFAFPFFFSTIFPRRTKALYLLTSVLFIVWKTPFVQPVIDYFNSIGLLTNRTVDYSDYIALIILPVSFHVYNRSAKYSLKPVFVYVIAGFSVFSFVATTRPKGSDTNFVYTDKVYDFNFSKRDLVSKLNAIQLEYVHDMQTYASGNVDFNSETNIFYYRYNETRSDTIAVLLDYKKVKDLDTVLLRSSYAHINISGNDHTSQLKLLSLKGYVRESNKANDKDNPLKFFEKAVIKKIRNYK
ncbi:MAG TPA: hypothetical protein VGN20_22500 [Mucilaginibacter sp.]|jgi:hypothetical protein